MERPRPNARTFPSDVAASAYSAGRSYVLSGKSPLGLPLALIHYTDYESDFFIEGVMQEVQDTVSLLPAH